MDISDYKEKIFFLEGEVIRLKMENKRLKQDVSRAKAPKPRKESILRRAMDLLEEREYPLKMDETLEGIGLALTPENRSRVSSSMGNYMRKGLYFDRVAPNVYKSKDFKNENEYLGEETGGRGYTLSNIEDIKKASGCNQRLQTEVLNDHL